MQPLDRATTLVLGSDGKWAYGGCDMEAEEALRHELKDAQILVEENGLVAKIEQSRAIEVDGQLVPTRVLFSGVILISESSFLHRYTN